MPILVLSSLVRRSGERFLIAFGSLLFFRWFASGSSSPGHNVRNIVVALSVS